MAIVGGLAISTTTICRMKYLIQSFFDSSPPRQGYANPLLKEGVWWVGEPKLASPSPPNTPHHESYEFHGPYLKLPPLIDSAGRRSQNLRMLPFKQVIWANDRTIKEYIWIAGYIGVEDVNWTWKWADGGRAIFRFDTERRLWSFKFMTWRLRSLPS
jgi:hypothetical protein